MERRNALKTMAVSLGGLVSLPAWATGWTPDAIRLANPLLNSAQNDLLADVVETIIPATDTPGANALNVHQFVQRMVADCYDKPAQQQFTQGLDAVNERAQQKFTKPFTQLAPAQRTELLTQLTDDPAQKAFFGLVKNLTIRGYMTSEYVMTNLTHYQFIPGHYHGCVPVAKKETSSPNPTTGNR